MENGEKTFLMGNKEEVTYKFGNAWAKYNISKKVECNSCKYCAPNIPENRSIVNLQDGDTGLCFKGYPEQVIIIGPGSGFRKEMNCTKIDQTKK